MTGRVLAQQWISVDGRVSGPTGEGELFATAPAASAEATETHNLELMESVDTVLLGRRTYESFRAVWPGSDNPMAGRVNGTPKVVCSSSLEAAPWDGFPPCTVVRDAVAWARGHRGDERAGVAVLWGSIAVMRALITAGQLDELEVFVAPALLGAGVPLLDAAGTVRMELTESQRWPGGLVRHRYRLPV